MNKINKIILCITLGDPCGIGPEVVAKTLCFMEKKKLTYFLKL